MTLFFFKGHKIRLKLRNDGWKRYFFLIVRFSCFHAAFSHHLYQQSELTSLHVTAKPRPPHEARHWTLTHAAWMLKALRRDTCWAVSRYEKIYLFQILHMDWMWAARRSAVLCSADLLASIDMWRWRVRNHRRAIPVSDEGAGLLVLCQHPAMMPPVHFTTARKIAITLSHTHSLYI